MLSKKQYRFLKRFSKSPDFYNPNKKHHLMLFKFLYGQRLIIHEDDFFVSEKGYQEIKAYEDSFWKAKKENVSLDARVKKIILTSKAKLLHNDIVMKFDNLNDNICKNITEL